MASVNRASDGLERRSSLNENLQRKQNWAPKSTNLEENAGKISVVSFCHRSSPGSRKAWTLPWKLQELKKYPRKACGYGQPRSYFIRVLNERSVNDGGDFSVFCGWWFSNQLDIVSKTHFSCDTVDRGLWLPVLSLAAVSCNGQEHSHRKARLCILFYWF